VLSGEGGEVKFWQAFITATLAADMVRTNMHTDWPWWLHALATGCGTLTAAAMWAAFKWLFAAEPDEQPKGAPDGRAS
jgi:drug/metabolite transporter (DMT)-like permease